MKAYKTDRLLIAYGGLILLVGIFMLFLSIMSLTKFIDLTPLIQRSDLLIYSSLVVGALDLVCGILLAFSKKQEPTILGKRELGEEGSIMEAEM